MAWWGQRRESPRKCSLTSLEPVANPPRLRSPLRAAAALQVRYPQCATVVFEISRLGVCAILPPSWPRYILGHAARNHDYGQRPTSELWSPAEADSGGGAPSRRASPANERISLRGSNGWQEGSLPSQRGRTNLQSWPAFHVPGHWRHRI